MNRDTFFATLRLTMALVALGFVIAIAFSVMPHHA